MKRVIVERETETKKVNKEKRFEYGKHQEWRKRWERERIRTKARAKYTGTGGRRGEEKKEEGRKERRGSEIQISQS